MYPVVVLEGLAHSSFMNSTMLPAAILAHDLNPEVDEETGYGMVASAVTSFMGGILGDPAAKASFETLVNATAVLLQPLADAMELEGDFNMKPGCDSANLTNPRSPKCLQGAPWSETAQAIMGNGVAYHHITKNLTIKAHDNFHGDSLMDPTLLPLVNGTNCTSAGATCSMAVISATDNAYDKVSDLDTGATPVAATAMAARMVSRQAI